MLKKSLLNKKNYTNIIYLLIVFCIMLSCFRLWLNADEGFSINLVSHSYRKMIYLDSIDVHPPLYYIMLKTFLLPIGYFGNSFLLKVIFARILSFIFSVATFFYLRKLSNYFTISISMKKQFIIFLMLPGVLYWNPYDAQALFNIRMYSLSAMFFVMSFYYILKYLNNDSKYSLSLIIILSICSSYTHYFSAMMSGILILSYCVYFLAIKSYKYFSIFLFIGMGFLIFNIPWIGYSSLNQLGNVSKGYWIGYGLLLKNMLLILLIAFLFTYMFVKLITVNKSDKRRDLIIILIVNVVTLSLVFMFSILDNPILMLRYMYPSFLLFEFLSMSYFSFHIRNSKIEFNNFYMLAVPLIFIFSILFSANTNLKNNSYIFKEFHFIKDYNSSDIDMINFKYIRLHENFSHASDDEKSKQNLLTQSVMYAGSIHKKIILTSKNRNIVLKQFANDKFYDNLKYYIVLGK